MGMTVGDAGVSRGLRRSDVDGLEHVTEPTICMHAGLTLRSGTGCTYVGTASTYIQ